MDRSRYPADWNEITRRIRGQALHRCECRGECGVDHDRDSHPPVEKMVLQTAVWSLFSREQIEAAMRLPGRCWERNRIRALHFRGRVVLTVAHLDHDTDNNDPSNLRAMCQRCHNRYDRAHRSSNRAKRAARELEEAGQQSLLLPMD